MRATRRDVADCGATRHDKRTTRRDARTRATTNNTRLAEHLREALSEHDRLRAEQRGERRVRALRHDVRRGKQPQRLAAVRAIARERERALVRRLPQRRARRCGVRRESERASERRAVVNRQRRSVLFGARACGRAPKPRRWRWRCGRGLRLVARCDGGGLK